MLRQRAKSAVIWSGLDFFMRQGLGFVVTIILARLLLPEDFGTIALLSLFLGVAGLFVNAGFSAALIQKQDTTHVDESTVFWFNIAAAALMTILLCAISPWIADFFALPVLMPITILMAFNIFLGSLGTIHGTLLNKKLDFKTPMKIGAASTIVSGCVGIYMAWSDYGVWALVAQTLSGTLVGTILLWYFSAWRPHFIFCFDSFKQMFGFSSWLFGSWMLDTLYQRGYTLLIGKFYGTYDLGIYNRADSTQQLPSSILAETLSRVAFPLFSSINRDRERLSNGVKMSVRVMMMITAPTMMGLAVVADPFIRLVFGEKWLPAVPLLQILCITGILLPLHVINLNVMQAQGHSHLYFRLELIKKTIGILLLLSGSFFGLMGIAWARAIQSTIALAINGHYTKKFLGYGAADQIKDCMPSILLSLSMIAVVSYAQSSFNIGGIVGLLAMISLGAFIYLSGNVLLGTQAFKEALTFIRSKNIG